jgi:hypothetical protein
MIELEDHIKNCEHCHQEFQTIEQYQTLTAKLQKFTPKLNDKEFFINQVFDQLPDLNTETKENQAKTFRLFPQKIRLFAASLAASLVLLFVVQQTSDALKIKQLENKFAYEQRSVDYTLLKTSLIINLLNQKTEYRFHGLLSKARKTLQIKTFAMLKKEYSLLTKTETNNKLVSGSHFYADSIYHP